MLTQKTKHQSVEIKPKGKKNLMNIINSKFIVSQPEVKNKTKAEMAKESQRYQFSPVRNPVD